MTALDVTDPPVRVPVDDEPPPGDFPFGLDTDRPSGPPRRWRLPENVNWPEVIITFVIVAFLVGFVFKYLQPSKLFLNSTPAGGDTGAHVWGPAFLRDHLLTHFRLTGWAPDWYSGFPSLVFYFPLPSLLIVILNLVMPYNVAFKLITVFGLLTLPVAAWFFGRLARFRFPGPVLLAAGTLPFLFSRNFTIYGGNIASTLAGEFGFSISLSLTLVFLGLVARGLETGKYRALAAVVLMLTGLSHLLPALFAIVGGIVLVLLRWDRRSWRWITPVFAVAGGLAAFWWLPFLLRLPYATDMGYEKLTQYHSNLLPPHQLSGALYVLAIVGVFVSLLRRQKLGIFLGIMAGISVVVFRFGWPVGRLWNARVLPFWFLCLYLLAAVAIAEGGALLLEPLRGGEVPAWSRIATLILPVVAAMAVWIWVGFPLHGLPGGKVTARTGQYTWLGISNADNSFIPAWATWNYSGYESTTKSRKAEYFGLIKTMTQLGKSNGCGRAMWEYEPGLDQMGTPDALMLLPYWTNACIGSMEGLYYESSATTPYHFINAAELSLQPSDPVRGLNYPSSPNVADGVRHLQLLGVRYYMALTPETQMQADTNPDLTVVATSGPWPESYPSGTQSSVKERTWKIYQVADSQIVAPLINQPVVMKGVSKGGKGWLDASEAWYLDQNRADVMYAASGPSGWSRVAPMATTPPRTSLPAVLVDHILSSDNAVSFNVDTVGVPVLVKVSYFPNWQARGAKGPYRVAPNLMVVIPTSHHVVLAYANTPVDWFGDLLGLLGLAALVWLVRAKPVVFSAPRRPLASPVGGGATTETGVDDAYVRLRKELAAGMISHPPGDDGSPPGTQDIDQWLGFPGGLGNVSSAPPPSGAGPHGPPDAAPGSVASAPADTGGLRAPDRDGAAVDDGGAPTGHDTRPPADDGGAPTGHDARPPADSSLGPRAGHDAGPRAGESVPAVAGATRPADGGNRSAVGGAGLSPAGSDDVAAFGVQDRDASPGVSRGRSVPAELDTDPSVAGSETDLDTAWLGARSEEEAVGPIERTLIDRRGGPQAREPGIERSTESGSRPPDEDRNGLA